MPDILPRYAMMSLLTEDWPLGRTYLQVKAYRVLSKAVERAGS